MFVHTTTTQYHSNMYLILQHNKFMKDIPGKSYDYIVFLWSKASWHF